MRLAPYIAISLAVHVLILLIPLKTGGLFSKKLFKKKKEKPTLVRIIEIPGEKPEKKKVKPPKKPKVLSRYTHRTKKESAPKPSPPSKAQRGKKGLKKERKKPRKKSVKELLRPSEKGRYKLPPLEDLLPSPEEMAKREKPIPIPKKEGKRGFQEDLSDIVKEEKNILSLNTMEFKYISYFASIKRKIELLWSYPREAIIMGMEGKLVVRFVIDKDGSLKELKLIKSSGYKILDDEAINAIKDAAPFNPIPERLGVDHLTITATFHYILIR